MGTLKIPFIGGVPERRGGFSRLSPSAATPQPKKKFLAEAQRLQSDRAICTDWKLSALLSAKNLFFWHVFISLVRVAHSSRKVAKSAKQIPCGLCASASLREIIQ
jgi:hypothetical protein